MEEIFRDFSCSCLLPCGHRGARRGLSALPVPLPPPRALPLPGSSHGLAPASALPTPAGPRHPPRRAHPEVLVAVLADLAVRVAVEPAERGVQQPGHGARTGPAAGPRRGDPSRSAAHRTRPEARDRRRSAAPRDWSRWLSLGAGRRGGSAGQPISGARARRECCVGARAGCAARRRSVGALFPRLPAFRGAPPEGPWRERGWRLWKVPRVVGSPFPISAATGG